VHIQEWNCRSNFPEADFLEPDETLVQKLSVVIDPTVRRKAITFRLGFVPHVPDDDSLEFFNNSVAVREGACPPSRSPLVGPLWSDKVTITPQMLGQAIKLAPEEEARLQRLEEFQRRRQATFGHVMRHTGG
jgi:hypothetical protein